MGSTPLHSAPRLVVVGPMSLRENEVIFQSLDSVIARMEQPEVLLAERNGVNQVLLEYGRQRRLKVRVHLTQVITLGPSLPFLRNQELVEEGTHFVVFWDGRCQHTSHLIDLARRENKPTCVFYTDNVDAHMEENG